MTLLLTKSKICTVSPASFLNTFGTVKKKLLYERVKTSDCHLAAQTFDAE